MTTATAGAMATATAGAMTTAIHNSLIEVLNGNPPLFNVFSMHTAGIKAAKKNPALFYELLLIAALKKNITFIRRCGTVPNAVL